MKLRTQRMLLTTELYCVKTKSYDRKSTAVSFREIVLIIASCQVCNKHLLDLLFVWFFNDQLISVFNLLT